MYQILLSFLFVFCVNAFASGNSTGDQIGVQQQIVVTATTTSTLVLSKNLDRKYLLIQNNGATAVSVKFKSAHVAAEGLVIPANGGSYEMLKAPTDVVYLKASAGTDSVVIVEGN